MPRLLSLLIAVICASVALCIPPTLELPQQIDADPGAIILEAKTSGKAVAWHSIDAGLTLLPQRLLTAQTTAVAIAIKPGTYRVLAVACAGDELSAPALCLVCVKGPEMAPAPAPTPAQPATAPRWVVIIEETATAAATRGAMLANPDLSAFLRSRGWHLRIADQDARDASGKVPADLAGYLKRVAGRPLPYLFVVAADGTVLTQGALPATAAELLTLLQRIGG